MKMLETIRNNTMQFADTDSYIISHWKQFPKGMTDAQSYGVARGSRKDKVVFFGLQSIIRNFRVPSAEEVEAMREACALHFGRDDVFNYDGWMEIVALGYLPLRIRALPEGTEVPKGTALFTVENTRKGFGWLPGWYETQLVRSWYGTNTATLSRRIRRLIKKYLEKNGTVEQLPIKLHSFGSRAATGPEAAALGDMGHLLSFVGTDTFGAWPQAIKDYNAVPESLAFTIPASAHATITSWGKDFEIAAYRNMIEEFGGPGAIYACVSDSYDIFKALEMWKELEGEILRKGGTLVVRPDSGDPVETPVRVVKRLMELFGSTQNEKGYAVLPDHIRVIQGDGINYDSIAGILESLDEFGGSADNINFGMGGELMQKHDRGTNDFSFKMCWRRAADGELDVFKDPVTDTKKTSLRGRLKTVWSLEDGGLYTIREEDFDGLRHVDAMITVFEDGVVINQTFEDIRARLGD